MRRVWIGLVLLMPGVLRAYDPGNRRFASKALFPKFDKPSHQTLRVSSPSPTRPSTA